MLENYHESDRLLLIELIYKVIFNNPEDNCYIKGRRSDWKGLPKSKSLFTVAKGKGLPIGNLTSQILPIFILISLTSLWWKPAASNITGAMSMTL